MRRVLVVGFAALLIPAMASAQTEPTPLADFTSLCEETASTGFNWGGGEWVGGYFKPASYVLRKASTLEVGTVEGGPTNICIDRLRRDRTWNETQETRSGCYSFLEVGKQQIFVWCDELYNKQGAGWIIAHIECAYFGVRFAFLPNSNFQRSRFHSDVSTNPDDDYKDSLMLSHGKCTIIQ